MTARGRAARAAAPVLGLLLLLAGCGGSAGEEPAEDGAGRQAAATESAGPAEERPAPAGEADEETGEAAGEAAGSALTDLSSAEPLPEDELAPPDGEFTEEQREFLVERVPAGVAPGAVLDQGMAACERLGYLARHAPEAIPEAVAAGEIPEAEAAVTHLCPEYAESLAPAG
ncbi:hypothetical protein RM844_00745 [Streptomyces sp. DSM 44915]|uniref:DUF732 domain-containing protein n=1 Tax=Streptomyces chisholmiae TaxID=3075540 RepID=A0ABU2JIJ8_9ACTN|nr:hypothetical protein [Streptomyces sp. DSM 44915]MDT0264810.1 hypothetical protein [Streptomyces sp. DSM 44915]